MKGKIKSFYWRAVTKKWEGVGVIEVILILVIIIGLVLLFKNQITAIIDKAFKAITEDSGGITG